MESMHMTKLSPRITTMIRMDHTHVLATFHKYRIDSSPDKKEALVNTICAALEIHAQLEEEIFYPLARQTVDDEMMLLEADEEHHVAETMINELLALDPTDERYVAKCIVLKEMVEHHIEEEETELFPKMRDELGRNRLQEIGEEMVARKDALTKEIQLT
jgi:hemerythrin-like domain-containing protein